MRLGRQRAAAVQQVREAHQGDGRGEVADALRELRQVREETLDIELLLRHHEEEVPQIPVRHLRDVDLDIP